MMALSIKTQVFFGAFLFVTLYSGAIGHSYVTSPQSRSNQGQTQAGCRGPACLGPCEIPLSSRQSNAAVHVAARGDSVTVNWPRNNHAGGFIRFAWAPTAQSDNATYFDNHVQQINCHEVGGCYPDDPSNPNGGDSGPGNGSSRACSSTFNIPANLANGEWTLQWAWFGGAFSLGDYYSCVDYKISGGNSGAASVPVFIGGDYSFPKQNKCKFFNTDRLHVCVNEPCSNAIYSPAEQQSGPPAFVQENFNGVPLTPTTPAPTQAAVPSTTGASAVIKPTAAPTLAPTPVPTNAPSTPAPSATLPPSSGSCVSGHMKCVASNSFSMCDHEAWGATQNCASGTYCSPSGDYVYCLNNPSPTPSTTSTPTPTKPSSSTSSSSVNAGSCTLGYQKCVGGNTYQTCGNGLKGPSWAGLQSCQAGLSCHASATANNIYCY